MQIVSLPRWATVIFAIFIGLSQTQAHQEQPQPTSDNLTIHHYLTKTLHLLKSQRTQSQETALKPVGMVLLAGLFCFIAASISSAGGIGGGGLFIPILTIVAGLDLKTASSFSAFMIMGGSVANVMYNLCTTSEKFGGKTLIDYDIALLSEPCMLLGVSIGVTCNLVFPEWLITILFAVFLALSTFKTFKNAILYWKMESDMVMRRGFAEDIRVVPFFKFEELTTATNNFNIANLLGKGGFGLLYKGTLQNGKEIAVKRLSSASGQGLDKFKNEVLVISNLQHRNLVKLLGCCVEGEEKILVYEYMPNKSLDTYLFDLLKKELLGWRTRFNIIEGISQGLLYLHRHSRLRIIHRNLKASNILLDEKLQPKISDFGLARIFGDNEDQANTKRVVGTYGYMPPEYAMEGLFSDKSDIFSFGVLLLEIVSGRRNSSFYNDEHVSLVGYAWKLWNEGNILALVDNMVSDPCNHEEVLRCIHVGLLCVQEFAKDRPNMSTTISMLNSEIVDLPSPKQLAFTLRQNNASDAEPRLINRNAL